MIIYTKPLKKASVEVNSTKKSNAAAIYEEYAAEIESLADFILKHPKMVYSTRRSLHNELAVLLLKAKNLKTFVPGGSRFDELLVNQFKGHEYSGLIFMDCYEYAWKCYGTHDRDTGEVVPFLKWFNYMYKLKYGEIISEMKFDEHPWETKYKQTKLRELLRNAIAEMGFEGKLPRINVLNRMALVVQLEFINAPQSYFAKVEEIFEENHVGSSDCHEADGTEMDRSFADSESIENYEYANLVVENLLNNIERLADLAEGWKDSAVRKNLTYYVTLRAREYLRIGDTKLVMMLKEFIDEDLLDYAYRHEDDNDTQILASYFGQDYNTARKKLRKVEKAFIDMSYHFGITAA